MIRGAVAGIAIAVSTVAVPATAARCAPADTTTYDTSALRFTFSLDLAECGAVRTAGNVTMRAWVTRTDSLTGERTRLTTVRVRCRPGARSCTVRARWPHAATERATYDVAADWSSDGRRVVAGSFTLRTWCTSVAGAHANCALPI